MQIEKAAVDTRPGFAFHFDVDVDFVAAGKRRMKFSVTLRSGEKQIICVDIRSDESEDDVGIQRVFERYVISGEFRNTVQDPELLEALTAFRRQRIEAYSFMSAVRSRPGHMQYVLFNPKQTNLMVEAVRSSYYNSVVEPKLYDALVAEGLVYVDKEGFGYLSYDVILDGEWHKGVMCFAKGRLDSVAMKLPSDGFVRF